MARTSKPRATSTLADLMSEDGAAYVGETHDPNSAAPPEPPEELHPLIDARLDLTSIDGAIHVTEATLAAYVNRKVSDRQVATLMEIIKTSSGLLATKARVDKPKADPTAMPAIEEQVRMLTQTGPFGMFAAASRTVRVHEAPMLMAPPRVPTLMGDE
jgi:hypothetical protein